jgi:hypothetical protein
MPLLARTFSSVTSVRADGLRTLKLEPPHPSTGQSDALGGLDQSQVFNVMQREFTKGERLIGSSPIQPNSASP